MGGWWGNYSFTCQPVEHETTGRPMRVSLRRLLQFYKQKNLKTIVMSWGKGGKCFEVAADVENILYNDIVHAFIISFFFLV